MIDLVNVGLMVLAAGAAIALPFETFLVAYAVLGPFHYLTEIAWLHQRRYFSRAAADPWLLGGLAVAATALTLVPGAGGAGPRLVVVYGVALSVAAVMAYRAGWRSRALVIAGAALLLAVVRLPTLDLLLLFYLSTLIHVFVFTGAFILHGALRARSLLGIASLVVFVACAAATLGWDVSLVPEVSLYTRQAYAPFVYLNFTLGKWLGFDTFYFTEAVFSEEGGISVMRFVAFAYTYHYLNWFSKTSVIGWHRIPRRWAITNVVLATASIALYAWDYTIGFRVVFFLSLLHVFLELPLDHRTFVGIGREVGSLRAWARA